MGRLLTYLVILDVALKCLLLKGVLVRCNGIYKQRRLGNLSTSGDTIWFFVYKRWMTRDKHNINCVFCVCLFACVCACVVRVGGNFIHKKQSCACVSSYYYYHLIFMHYIWDTTLLLFFSVQKIKKEKRKR